MSECRAAARVPEWTLLAPYAAWMGLMAVLPGTAWAYAVRGAVTLALLVAGWLAVCGPRVSPPTARQFGLGLAAGLLVFAIWIAPETLFARSAPVAAAESPYSPVTCGWGLTLAKLAGSAFVIAVAEELFFRKWLVEFAGFWWMVALFAVEHGDRWAVGAVTGVIYGVLAKRFGLKSAIVAHVTTNLVLGLWVICRDEWRFW